MIRRDRRFCFKLVREQCKKKRKQNSLTKKMVYTHNEKRIRKTKQNKKKRQVIVLHNDNR